MAKYLVLLLCLMGGPVSASNWRPSDRLLHAVRYVESTHGLFTWGDNGRSLGDFQISEAAWLDVNGWRKSRGLRTYSYRNHVWDRNLNRLYAADYLAILHRELTRRIGRHPTVGELYAAYNMGLAAFAQCDYQLSRVNPVTAKKCRQITLMVGK